MSVTGVVMASETETNILRIYILSVVNFRNSWGVLVFKVGGLRIRLGSVDGH